MDKRTNTRMEIILKLIIFLKLMLSKKYNLWRKLWQKANKLNNLDQNYAF